MDDEESVAGVDVPDRAAEAAPLVGLSGADPLRDFRVPLEVSPRISTGTLNTNCRTGLTS